MDYNARFYSSRLGRFASADTVIPESTQGTQAWDRYAYANNSPLRYNDPSGHDVGCGGRDASECASKVIFFGGSYPDNIEIPGPSPFLQSPIWTTDLAENPVEVVPYPGTQSGVPGKQQQAINAQGLLTHNDTNLIGYSAGTESALMYAQWRLENGQAVNSIVLLGPTFETENMNFDKPHGGWSAVMDDLIGQGVNIYVLDDGSQPNAAHGYTAPVDGNNGIYRYVPKWIDHYSEHPNIPFMRGTNNSPALKQEIYSWLARPE